MRTVACHARTKRRYDRVRMSLLAHLQTISSMLPLRRVRRPRGLTRELLRLPIADQGGEVLVQCDWQPQRAPLVVILHGVAGDSRDPYVWRAADACLRAGFHTARLNQRGSGMGRKRARTMYHAALTDDVALLEAAMVSRANVDGMALLGFSLGGHTALRYACQPRASSLLRAVTTISAPLDLPLTMRHLQAKRTGLMGVYQTLMVRSIVRGARAMVAHRRDAEALISASALRGVRSLMDVDRTIMMAVHGFADVHAFQADASVAPHISRIDVPTLLVHADDDPVIPVEQVRAVSGVNELVTPVVVRRGGHIGFHEHVGQLWGASFAVTCALGHFKTHLTRV